MNLHMLNADLSEIVEKAVAAAQSIDDAGLRAGALATIAKAVGESYFWM